MQDVYELVAQKFAERIGIVFASEETLEACFLKHFPGLTFDRTNHWQNIMQRELAAAWKQHGPAVITNPISHDIDEILWRLKDKLDYNLFSQVLLNLQVWLGVGYSVPDARKELEGLQQKYAGKELTPFAEKAKMKRGGVTESERIYNDDLSSIKALKIISEFTPMNSFRVSPKGSTPALADARNLSTLGWGADKYARAICDLKIYYVTWDVGSTPTMAEPSPTANAFIVKGIDYPFVSKSGGEVLNEMLFSRLIAVYFYSKCRPQIVLPRMNSVMIVAHQAAGVKRAFDELRTMGVPLGSYWQVLSFHEGSRVKSSAVDSNQSGVEGADSPSSRADS